MTQSATNETVHPDPVLEARPENRVWKKFRSHKSAMVGGALVVFFILIALAAPILPIPDPAATDWGAVRKAPSWDHWMGTDEIGRDVMARLIWGAQASLAAGVVSVGIAVLFGVPLGIVAGYFGGWTDAVISRCTEALLAVPFLILAIALAAFLGPSLTNAMIAIGISATPIFIRLTRGQVLSIKEEDYVESARASRIADAQDPVALHLSQRPAAHSGASDADNCHRHHRRGILSFLGLGQQPPAPSWGSMLNTAKNFLNQAPWMAMWPGLSIFFVVLGFNLLGDGLRDALDPREH